MLRNEINSFTFTCYCYDACVQLYHCGLQFPLYQSRAGVRALHRACALRHSFSKLKWEWKQVYMMTSWEGFTDRELQRLKKEAEPPLALAAKEGDGLCSVVRQNSARKGVQSISNSSKMRANMVLSSHKETSDLPSEAFICQPASSTPENDDEASRTTSKTATDRNGASASSPSVRPSSLHPTESPPPSPGQCANSEELEPTGQQRGDHGVVDLTDQ